MVGSCFFNPVFYFLCLLIGGIEAIAFSVNIERCILSPVIFIPMFFTLVYSLFIGLLGQKGLFFLASSCLSPVSSSVCKKDL
jgi:hypothetical protein